MDIIVLFIGNFNLSLLYVILNNWFNSQEYIDLAQISQINLVFDNDLH